jgi:SSS family solute:Na+ symporter
VVTNIPQAWVDGMVAGDAGAAMAAFGGFAAWVRTNLTGQVISFIAMMASCAAYAVGSLATGVQRFELDRLLHRGKWRVEGDAALDEAPQGFWAKIGFDSQYKGWDKFVAWITLAWPLFFTLLFCVGTPWLLWRRAQGNEVTDAQWSAWWQAWSWFILASSTVVMVWFTIGGIRDYLRLRRDLRNFRADTSDDGTVR